MIYATVTLILLPYGKLGLLPIASVLSLEAICPRKWLRFAVLVGAALRCSKDSQCLPVCGGLYKLHWMSDVCVCWLSKQLLTALCPHSTIEVSPPLPCRATNEAQKVMKVTLCLMQWISYKVERKLVVQICLVSNAEMFSKILFIYW